MQNIHDDGSILYQSRAALVVGHPGHELRVYGWLATVRPEVFVLTDGSGASGVGRLESSSRTLKMAGAVPGGIYGHFSDAGIYKAIVEHDRSTFLGLAGRLAEYFVSGRIQVVVSDANEGFNPTHDLCREITCAAVAMAHRRTGLFIAHYEFCLTEWENGAATNRPDSSFHIELTDELLAAKLDACRVYPELRDEVDRALEAKGPQYFRSEFLDRVLGWTPIDETHKPQYETWGEQRVADGKYASVLRFREHLLPLFRALRAGCGADITSAGFEAAGPTQKTPESGRL